MVADALVGVEAAAWLRAWAGMSMEAKEGLLDSSEKKKIKQNVLPGYVSACNSEQQTLITVIKRNLEEFFETEYTKATN